jgi:hypothetical protein
MKALSPRVSRMNAFEVSAANAAMARVHERGFVCDSSHVTGGANSDCFWRLKSHLR